MAVYEIAGLRVDMEAVGRTALQAKPYLTDTPGPADCVIRCDPAALLRQMPQCKTEDLAEYMWTGAYFARRLLDFDGLQLHASAVELEGKAWLFTAPSGTGKSTHTEKWRRLFGAKPLNDDKPALRKLAEGWVACGTPWSGKTDLSSPWSVPLGGIACLERGEENRIRRMTGAEALPYIFSQCVRRLEADQMDRQLSLLDALLTQVPVWLLTARNDDEAAWVAREGML